MALWIAEKGHGRKVIDLSHNTGGRGSGETVCIGQAGDRKERAIDNAALDRVRYAEPEQGGQLVPIDTEGAGMEIKQKPVFTQEVD